MCRQWAHFGAWSSKLPADHWARRFGSACEWNPPKLRLAECRWCGDQLPVGRYTLCSAKCRHRSKQAARRGREFRAVGTYTWAQVVGLWMQFDKRCAYCRARTPLENIQAEHVTALARGGANNLSNLLPSCGGCNSDKRDLTLSDWAKDRARRNLPPVFTTWGAHDPRYRHLVYLESAPLAAA